MSTYMFNNTATFFAIIAQDNTLRVWNVQQDKQIQSHSDKSLKYTCINWFSNKTKQYLAAGTTIGELVVYSVLEEKLLWKLAGSHGCRVNDLVFSGDGKTLYSADADGHVVAWSIDSGKKVATFHAEENRPVSRLAINNTSTVLATASTIVRLWDLASLKMLNKQKSAANAFIAVDFVPGDSTNAAMASAAGDRYFTLYSTAGGDKSTAMQTLKCDSNIQALIMGAGANKNYLAAAITEAKAIDVFSLSATDRLAQAKIQLPVAIDTLTAAFSSKTELTVAYGIATSNKIKFEKIKFSSGGDMIREVIEVEAKEFAAKEKATKAPTKKAISIAGDAPELNVDVQIGGEGFKTDKKSAGTVVELIAQSLTSGDLELLLRALTVPIKTVKSTVQALPSPYAFSLLTRIISDLATDYHKSHIVVPWVNQIVKEHSVYLLTVPNLRAQLAVLNTVIDDKFRLQESLTKLVGKFELIESQGKTKNTTTINYDPSLVFEDNSEDDDDEEEMMNGNESGDEDISLDEDEDINSDDDDSDIESPYITQPL
eukprot:gene5732-6630_t